MANILINFKEKSMKKTLVIFALLLMPFVLTACTNPLAKKDETRNENNGSKSENNNESLGEKIKGNFMDLLGKGKDMKCTFETTTENGTSRGETYVSGNKVRSDIYTEDKEAGTFESHSLITDDWVYSWTSMSETGMKIKLSEMEEMGKKAEKQLGDMPDIDEPKPAEGSIKDLESQMDYNCTTWNVDESKFEVPVDVQFMDQTEMIKNMQNMMNNPESGLKNMCGMCNSLTGDEQSECKSRLNCE